MEEGFSNFVPFYIKDDKFYVNKGENFLALCERVKGLMFFENEIYEEMVKMTESKDEAIDNNDSSSEEC